MIKYGKQYLSSYKKKQADIQITYILIYANH